MDSSGRSSERSLRLIPVVDTLEEEERQCVLLDEILTMIRFVRFVRGDATAPEGDGPKIIAHVCNDIGAWGKGFVLAVSRRWSRPEDAYREWFTGGVEAGFTLGQVQLVQVDPSIWVANMIGQRGIRRDTSSPPIRYEALAHCLAQVAEKALELDASVHMPRIGCGLAGGEWSQVERLVQDNLTDRGVPVTVYDFA